MNTKKTKFQKVTPALQEPPLSSEYTYADLSHFHRTVIAILGKDKPNTLSVPELTTVLQYICIITSLLDTPHIINHLVKESQQNSTLSPTPYPLPKITGIGAISSSKKCLRELIKWMEKVVTIPDLTLEMLMDEYYTKFPYALKPSVNPKGRPVKPHPLKNKNKSSGKP
jgi:hypothetical protein